jgi:hypothetical protein
MPIMSTFFSRFFQAIAEICALKYFMASFFQNPSAQNQL